MQISLTIRNAGLPNGLGKRLPLALCGVDRRLQGLPTQ
jgi:hypothetical protein